jgi:hypothetical protein
MIYFIRRREWSARPGRQSAVGGLGMRAQRRTEGPKLMRTQRGAVESSLRMVWQPSSPALF